MPSMVQLPETVMPTVSKLQAVEKPVKEGFSGFLSRMLPEVGKGIDAYQEDNAKKNIALGMADELNGISRDVSWIDSNNYETGKEVQKISSTQAANQQKYLATVRSMAYEGKTSEEIYEYGKQYLRENIDSVYYSGLNSQLKEMLYEAGIKETTVYQKAINESIKEVTQVNAVKDANTRVAQYYSIFRNTDVTPEGANDLMDAMVQKSIASSISNLGMPPAEAAANAEGEVVAMFKHWNDQLDPSDPNTAKHAMALESAIRVAEERGHVSFKSLNELQTQANTSRSNILQYNGVQMENQLLKMEWDAENSGTPLNVEQLQGYVDNIYNSVQSGTISPEVGNRLSERANAILKTSNEKLLAGMYSPANILANGITLSQYIMAEKGGEASYSEKVFAGILTNAGGDQVTAGVGAMNFALQGNRDGQYLPSLMRKGSETLVSQFIGVMSMTPEQAEKNPNYGNAQKAFEQFKSIYNSTLQGNGTLAEEMLAGVPATHIDIVRDLIKQGGTLHSARDAVANPAEANRRRAMTVDAIKGVTADTLNANWFGNTMGGFRWWKGMSKDVQGAMTKNVQAVYNSSLSQLSVGVTTDDPDKLYAHALKSGMHFQDGEYNDTMFSYDSAKHYSSIQHKGVTIPRNVVSAAADDIRREVAKQAGTIPDNVLIYSTNPNIIAVQAFDKSGQLVLNAGGSAWNGKVYTADEFTKRVKNKYDEQSTQYSRNQSIIDPVKRTLRTISHDTSDLSFDKMMEAKKAQDKADNARWANKGTVVNNKAYVGKSMAGGKHPIQVAATHAVPFGGNAQLAQSWVTHLNNYEGWHNNITVVKGKKGGDNDGENIGNGFNVRGNSKWRAKAVAAQGNPQAIMDLQGEFTAAAFKSNQKAADEVGMPVASTGGYDSRYVTSQLLIADMTWHSGNTRSIVKVLQQPTYQQAITELKKTREYQHAGDDHRRNVWRRNAVRDFYVAKGKL